MTTTPDKNKVIVSIAPSDSPAVATTRVHHHDFPEVHAEGESCAAAGEQLTNVLARVLDSAPAGYGREAVEQALADVREFVAHNP